MSPQPKLASGARASGRPAVAARFLHGGLRGDRGRLHARRRTRPRRRHQDRHRRACRRRGQGQGVRRRDAGLLRAPRQRAEPPGHPGGDGGFRAARIHPGRHAPARRARGVRGGARLLFPQGRGSHEDHRLLKAGADRQQQAGCRAPLRPRRHCGVGQVAGRRHQPPRHHWVLPRRSNVWEYAAHNKDLKAAVAFYGTLVDPPAQKSLWPKSPTELAPEMKAPVLGLYGEADQGIPLSQVDAMKAALQGAGKAFEIKVYAGAPHGFHADYRASYRKEAAEDAWKEMIAWFKTYKVMT